MKLIKICVIALALALGLGGATANVFAKPTYETYTYSYQGEPVLSPDACRPVVVKSFFFDACGPLNMPQDIFAAPDGKVYIADTGNNRVVVCDGALNVLTVISGGDGWALSAPAGVFMGADGLLYIADTGNRRIVGLDGSGRLVKTIEKPVGNGIADNFEFLPTALVVDVRGQAYVVAKGNTSGVMVFSANGKFEGFIGAQQVIPGVMELFTRLFMTKEQRARLRSAIPTEYCNIALDREGFIYVTDSSQSSVTINALVQSRSKSSVNSPIKKINPMGDDVMTRGGFFPPVGDVKITFGYGDEYGASRITDVAACENGMFSLLDARRNKIFTYDEEGNLLYAFAGTGQQDGLFEALGSLTYYGLNLLALDIETGCVTVFSPTEYGKLINRAIQLYNDNDFKGAAEAWAKVAEYNNNFDTAYIGMGKSLYQAGNYEAAMAYFESAHDKLDYSSALGKMREAWIERYFLLVPLVILGAVFAMAKVSALVKKHNAAGDYETEHSLVSQLIYAGRAIFHPFDGFYQIKVHKRGSVASATILLVISVLSYLAYTYFAGYLFRPDAKGWLTLMTSILTVVLPVILWTAANWCFTCLMEGEGTFRQIYITACYGLVPLIPIFLATTVLSRFLLLDEAAFISMLQTVGFVWTAFLIFSGTLVIHNYTLGRNIATTLLSLLGMVVILFISVLFIALMQRMGTFFLNIYNEIIFRT